MSKPRDWLRKHSEALLDDTGVLLAIILCKDWSYLSADMSWMLTKLVGVPLHTQGHRQNHITRIMYHLHTVNSSPARMYCNCIKDKWELYNQL